MPKNVMKLLKPSPNRGRNDFDLSHRHVFDFNFGELLPATAIETVPGDTIRLRVSDLLRTMPLVTSPFLRAKQHIDFWFVPFRDLWQNFDNFITSRDEVVQSSQLDARFVPWAYLSDMRYLTVSDGGYKDIHGKLLNVGSPRLLSLLGYATVDRIDVVWPSSLDDSPKVNLWRLAAYQYIWYNEYRLNQFDDGLNIISNWINDAPQIRNVAGLFNFDDLQCDSVSSALVGGDRLAAMCQIRYRPWKKDLFTGLLPSQQFGSVSTVNWSSQLLQNSIPSDTRAYLGVSGGNVSDKAVLWRDSTGNVLTTVSAAKVNSSFDVLSLRRSEAIQIWRENALRAGNRTSDNMRAHYGVESDFRDHRPVYLGSVDSPLNIGDINVTANGSDSSVNNAAGDIAGKGMSSIDANGFTFKAKDFGILMPIFSVLPEAEYNGIGIDRMNQLIDAEDYFIPEYENLGLEGVSTLNFTYSPISASKIAGYAPRYYGYKQKLDKVFGDMEQGRQLSVWTSPRPNFAIGSTEPFPNRISDYYVNPSMFDNNFSVDTSNLSQFIADIYFEVDAIRPMSVTGLPFS